MTKPEGESGPARGGADGVVKALIAAFNDFLATMCAATVSTPEGGRVVLYGAHAIALSEEADKLYRQLFEVDAQLHARYGKVLSEAPGVQVLSMGVGGAAASAKLVAAMDSARMVVAFPLDRWNEMQAANPGGNHKRFRSGDVLSACDVEVLESARKLLELLQPGNEGRGDEGEAQGRVPKLDGWTRPELIADDDQGRRTGDYRSSTWFSAATSGRLTPDRLRMSHRRGTLNLSYLGTDRQRYYDVEEVISHNPDDAPKLKRALEAERRSGVQDEPQRT